MNIAIFRRPLLVLSAAILSACASTSATAPRGPAPSLPEASASLIERDLRFLADDQMQGREAGSAAYEEAAAYVAQRFQELGLKPGGDAGAYLQAVPLRGTYAEADQARFGVHTAQGRTHNFHYGRDFYVAKHPLAARSSLRAPAVFVGYGVHSPRFQRDDFAGLDLRGKIVVLLNGSSRGLPSEEAAYYADEADAEAVRRGAVGLISVPTRESEKVFPWKKLAEYLPREAMTWIAPDGHAHMPTAQLLVSGGVNMETAAKLFEGAPRSYAQILDEAEKGAVRGFPLSVELSLTQASRHRDLRSSNVVGVLEGSDPALKHEAVVLSAHLDHLGRKAKSRKGEDAIYNGAMDNAAGVAVMIEAARLFAQSGQHPRRSLVFLAVTAEEKGLRGADYYARYSSLPAGSRIVGNVNLDMPLLSFDFADVVAFGAQHSSIGPAVARAAERIGIRLSPDPWPEEAIFVRSDHYCFVQQGVPAVFLVTGTQSTVASEDGAARWGEFFQKHYHQVSDEANASIRYDVGAKFALINYLVALELADADGAPQWNAGGFFTEIFGSKTWPETAR